MNSYDMKQHKLIINIMPTLCCYFLRGFTIFCSCRNLGCPYKDLALTPTQKLRKR